MARLRVLQLTGTPYEIGFQHGLAYAEDIRKVTAERIQLSCEPTWTGRSLSYKQVLELANACIPYHEDYAPDVLDELRGMSAATGIGLAELIIVGGFTDFVDVVYNANEHQPEVPIYGNECTAWLTSNRMMRDGHGMLAQTWDMHASATPYVILIHGKPDNAPKYYALSLTGCVAMIGMNSAGITVGINNLVGVDGQPGVTWNFVCRKILQQTTLDAALKCLTEARLAGGHNYLLMDAHGNGYNVEAMATAIHISELQDEPLVHTNLCLHENTMAVQRPLTPELIEDSTTRVRRAKMRMNGCHDLTEYDLMDIMRSREDGD
jgi:isopenicillin-N N-acyltransferase like protein